MAKPSPNGFTLIELLVTIAIVAILAAIAVPNFQTFLVQSQRRAVTNDFLASLALARSEAIKRGVPVRMQSLGTGAMSMQAGWVTFVDADGLGTVPAIGSSTLIERTGGYPASQVLLGCRLYLDSTSNVEYIRFDGSGRVVRANGVAGGGRVGIKILRNGTEAAIAEIVIGWGGRSRVAENTFSASCL